jgi:hypothetical protein
MNQLEWVVPKTISNEVYDEDNLLWNNKHAARSLGARVATSRLDWQWHR